MNGHELAITGIGNAAGVLYGCRLPECSWGWRAHTVTEAAAKFDENHQPPPKITKATQPTISETLWRCSSCGKWSHAKRKPSSHERMVWDIPFGAVVSRTVDGQDEDGGPATLTFIDCGPFEKWEAWKVESS